LVRQKVLVPVRLAYDLLGVVVVEMAAVVAVWLSWWCGDGVVVVVVGMVVVVRQGGCFSLVRPAIDSARAGDTLPDEPYECYP
jgi:hypothetical protein